MTMGLWIALGILVAILALGALWWVRAARRRCPIDGSVRCRNCRYEDDDASES